MQTIMVIWMVWHLSYLAMSEAQECRQLKYSQPVQDRALTNHEIIKINTTGEDICNIKCFMEPNCLSFNVGPLDDHLYLCEISDSDEALHPEDLVPRMGFTYQGTQVFSNLILARAKGSMGVNCVINISDKPWVKQTNVRVSKSPCSNGACVENSTCQAGYTSKGFRCICPTGFTGSSCSQDIDECSLDGGHDCPVNADCVNTEGSFNCTCSLGYVGDGRNCKECGAVGVEDRSKIPGARMTASSYYSSGYYPHYGRLNENRGYGAWCAATTTDRTDYLQVDMGAVHSVCAVATQGENTYYEWTTSYKVHLSTDGVTWNSYKENNVEKVFAGNLDRSSIVKHSLSADVKAIFVRFYPVTHYAWPCLRVEIFVLK